MFCPRLAFLYSRFHRNNFDLLPFLAIIHLLFYKTCLKLLYLDLCFLYHISPSCILSRVDVEFICSEENKETLVIYPRKK